ncbi:putative receptor-like serine/threonine-protein kinase [Panicum miliaceum]|uniref:Receptor-like serine/threonine-protein kinase n=1 Tax=Panicum miliaceum TaxID=4540 RepID=A0A3L6RL77_PANMI|nr:putative receptor-like serine/threonine-protein kinase [Panicum miliaceum]
MDTIEECGDRDRHLLSGSRILVGVPDNSRGCSELLSWAIGAVAKANDSVVAVHVLGGRGRNKRLQKANAFVIYMLGEFVEACEAKQINLEAKVVCSSNIGRALTQEAALTDGNILIVGRSRNAYHRSHFEIANYCFMHAPKNCSVIAVGREGLPQCNTRLKSRSFDVTKALRTRVRLERFLMVWRKGSTKSLKNATATSSHEVSRRGQNGLWRRLSDMKLWLPFLRTIGDDSARASDAGSAYAEDQKPAWRCFSFQEISVATNDFHPDNLAGRGGYAEVYKGVLSDGQYVAEEAGKRHAQHRIIHRDIKVSNVLLGDDFEPQISDFGLAKWLPKQWTHHSVIPIEGTFGYLAPEYFMHGIVDEKTDIFAFGVLLLEIVTGRRPIDCSKQSLLQWAKPLLEAGQATELADPNLGDDYDKDQLKRMILVASRCIMRPAMWRPSMAEEPEKWNIPEDEVDDMDDCTLFSESCSP